MAMEKAVIFRLAVTPFRLPAEINPLELIIKRASLRTEYTSMDRITAIKHETKVFFSLKL